MIIQWLVGILLTLLIVSISISLLGVMSDKKYSRAFEVIGFFFISALVLSLIYLDKQGRIKENENQSRIEAMNVNMDAVRTDLTLAQLQIKQYLHDQKEIYNKIMPSALRGRK